MKNTILFLRSLAFSILSFCITLLLSFSIFVFWLPFFPNRQQNMDRFGAWWSGIIIWLLKITTGIKSRVIGLEKLEKGKTYIIVGKHESAWETIFIPTLIKPIPSFILKKELLSIPFIGWCLATASMIGIDRSAGTKAIKKVLADGKKVMEKGHNIVIFPQGTRVPPESTTKEYPYKTGFIGLVKEMHADIIPMALNSGKFWRKKQFLKHSGTITMEFMDPIKYEEIEKMSKEELLLKLKNIIETKCVELNKI